MPAETGCTFVAGGSGGVGAAICAEFGRRGEAVALTYHRGRDKAEAVRDMLVALGTGVEIIELDLRDADATVAALQLAEQRFGQLRNVVYAAGPAFEMAFVSKLSPASWAAVFASDANGCFNLFHAALQSFKRQGFGNLVALTTCALQRPPRADVLSAAPKAAIDMLVKCIAKEEGRYGIRANTVELGFIAAGSAAHHIEHVWSPDIVAGILKDTPLRRFGTAAEVAKAVAFLCSDEAGFITGAALPVDGGFHL